MSEARRSWGSACRRTAIGTAAALERPWLRTYCQAIEERGSAVTGERVLSSRERIQEALFTGLRRREGVDLAAFRGRYGSDPLTDFGAQLREAFDAQLLELESDRLRLTERGRLHSNEVFRALV